MGLYEKRKVLGQVAPSASTETTLYDVGNSFGADDTDAVVGVIIVCNRGTTAGTFRVAIVPDGSGSSPPVPDVKHWIYYDIPLAANETFVVQMGIALNNDSVDDTIVVEASTANFSFTALGVEIDGTV